MPCREKCGGGGAISFPGFSYAGEEKLVFGTNSEKREAITTIGVAGVLSRIGTTTQALRLTCYLSQQNKAACYLEANNSGHIALLGQIYSESKQDESGLLRYGGIAMLSSLAPELLSSYTIRVIDCGTCYSGELFLSCQIQLIIGGSAPWELAALAPALESPRENRFYIFSLTSDCERQDILSFMGERFKTTLFAEYSPELFSELTQKEKEMYKKIEI